MSRTYAPERVTPVGATLAAFGWRPISRRQRVIDGLDLRIEPGERLLLAGPSGAGKSTVLRALAGVLGTTTAGELSGRVDVDGRVGLLLQNPLDSTVADRLGRDVAFGMENAGVPRSEMWPRIEAAVEAVRLPYPLDRPTRALSGGETQRLTLAGVLALRPGMLLLDEPTSMLDDRSAAAVRTAVVDAVARTGATLVVVEHRIAPWLDEVDRVVVLDEHGGRIFDGTPDTFVREQTEPMASAGVWMPDLPAPLPQAVPTALTEPLEAPARIAAEGLHVDLRTRTIRGAVTAQALRGIDIELGPGRLTAVTGPSGSGKSTLVAACAGLIAPTRGRVDAGEEAPPHKWRSAYLARRIGWVPQSPEHGFLTTRVRDEVTRTAYHLGIPVDGDVLLELFGLTALADANPYQLSGGEQRRLALVAALAHRPGAMLLDEPTVGQDRNTWAAVAGWVVSARRSGATAAVATHDADLIALASDEVSLSGGLVG
ncbi:ABC transporter ATP-binding protein [Solicola gregarius]|uniref:ATP-binding cassette domain-containing protein n=1 Tax=Solicola gregarius TaxID=2908642 RepID=A0AA46TKP0_9ACTN|nr:ATP-binding cassette domain-containing protein [Solicola gregarius]UYM07066.1 ATP-binding cassette domain-containing protein [Solicola gregarius]